MRWLWTYRLVRCAEVISQKKQKPPSLWQSIRLWAYTTSIGTNHLIGRNNSMVSRIKLSSNNYGNDTTTVIRCRFSWSPTAIFSKWLPKNRRPLPKPPTIPCGTRCQRNSKEQSWWYCCNHKESFGCKVSACWTTCSGFTWLRVRSERIGPPQIFSHGKCFRFRWYGHRFHISWYSVVWNESWWQTNFGKLHIHRVS